MPYSVLFTEKALKYLKKIDRYQAKLIISWIKKTAFKFKQQTQKSL